MIQHHLDPTHAILYMRPQSALDEEDFAILAKTVDPYIQTNGDLAGVIIEASTFPGWDSFDAMASHFRFVRDHHKHIKKIAVITDSAFGTAAEKLASQFVAAQIKHFPAGSIESAQRWIMAH